MSSSVGCPIVRHMISKPVARISAGITTLLVLGIFVTSSPLLPLFLLVDFALKGFFNAFAPTKCLSRGIVKLFRIPEKKVNAGPKIFAMKIGFWMSALLLIFSLLQWTVPLFITAGIFAIATGMEALFDFCLGCKMFPYYHKLIHSF